MYLVVGSRPDIAHSVSLLSQFNSCPQPIHWQGAKRILRYLKGTSDLSLVYKKTGMPIIAYADANYANCPIDRKSYTGYLFKFGNAPISWCSKKQSTVALSSTEAEYMSMAEASKESVFFI